MQKTKPFTHVVNLTDDINQLKKEIIEKDPNFFTFDFKCMINENADEKISLDDFWRLAKVKAKKVSLFVNEILSCDVLEDAPLGFIREITMPGSDITQVNDNQVIHIKERVVIDDQNKMLLFFQLEATGKYLLFAINQVTQENDNVYFSGHYVFNVPKDSCEKEDQMFMSGTNEVLPSRVNDMIAKMNALAKSGELNTVFRHLYS